LSVLKTYGPDTGFKPSKTYRLNGDRLEGVIDGLDAVKQSANFILGVERFEYPIYSKDYGTELNDLIGARRSYVAGDIERRIAEALAEDDRITGIEDFTLTFDRENAFIKFTVLSDFGEFDIERGVPIG